MITSERQYQVTKEQAERFRVSIDKVLEDKTLHRIQRRVYLDAYTSELDRLVEELEAWESQTK